jgi:anti-sigma factor ChrR (cupin superfamily)
VKRSPTADAARAALYALGALPREQQAAFEERLAGSAALRAEVEALHAAAVELLLAPDAVTPRPQVRERVLAAARGAARAGEPRPPLPDLLFALRADDVWIEMGAGLARRELAITPTGASYLIRVAPGATIPDHHHAHVEHSFVLSGSIEVEGTMCRAGDYHRAATGTAHTAFYSRQGCLMLIVEAAA